MEDNLFAGFESLLREIHTLFSRMREEYPEEVRCVQGCVDCCHACFDVSFIEALYIYDHLAGVRDAAAMNRAIDRAEKAREELEARLLPLGENPDPELILGHMSRWRIGCPLLAADNTCLLYDYRPVTCRVYGLPTMIGGTGHVCGFSGFDTGKRYPSVKLDNIWRYLGDLSLQAAEQRKEIDADDGRKRFFVHDIILARAAAARP